MNLMDNCLTFSSDHENVKDSIQLVVDESWEFLRLGSQTYKPSFAEEQSHTAWKDTI